MTNQTDVFVVVVVVVEEPRIRTGRKQGKVEERQREKEGKRRTTKREARGQRRKKGE
jgi:hypothetical protein